MNNRALRRFPLSKLMDLKVDFAFKQLFGSEKNKHITIVFLNAVLQRTGRVRLKKSSSNHKKLVENMKTTNNRA